LAEARAVFLAGCGLPGRWAGRGAFTVAELGFGVGVNVAALIELWSRARPPGGHLSIFSVEAEPVPAADARRALATWPELAAIAEALSDRWPGRTPGFHRREWPQWGVTLDVAVMEAGAALGAWSGAADAWFLDGFAPALNPGIWRPEVLALVAARSAPGARLATYTVAGAVRRGLAAAGFTVERHAGFGAKRERLEARGPGETPCEQPAPDIVVVGAGIAGAALARAFAARGVTARVFADAGDPGASRAPAALVAPRLDAGLAAPARLFAAAFARARALYAATGGAVLSGGALQLATGPKDARRFAAIAAADLFEEGEVVPLDAETAGARLGEAAPPGLWLAGALVVDPAAILRAWLGAPLAAKVERLERDGAAWRLVDARGDEIARAGVVVLAAGLASADLAGGLPLQAVRGQASVAPAVHAGASAIFGGYVAAWPGGVVFGATHDRDDRDPDPRAADHGRNLAAIREVLPRLAARLEAAPLTAHAGVRAAAPDFLPLAGRLAPGLYVLTGLGSRGFAMAPILAEHVASLVLGAPSPLPADQAALVDPARFAARASRRRSAASSQRVASASAASTAPQARS
jgi:tRNA 5-methylaminomethyl-2-thiouridine biosynthesis bifunctional protein